MGRISCYIILTLFILHSGSLMAADSLAYRVADAGGFEDGLRDAPNTTASVPETARDTRVSSAFDAAIATSYLTGMSAPPPGFSAGGAAGFHVLNMLVAGRINPFRESHHNHMVMWMPIEMAGSPEAAQQMFMTLVAEAMNKALPESYVASLQQTISLKGKKLWQLAMQGPGCGDTCRFYFYAFNEVPREISSPDFLGDYETYAYLKQAGRFSFHYDDEEAELQFKFADVYTRMSTYLPKWVYIYLAPQNDRAPNSPVIAPVVLNQGKVLYFIKPR